MVVADIECFGIQSRNTVGRGDSPISVCVNMFQLSRSCVQEKVLNGAIATMNMLIEKFSRHRIYGRSHVHKEQVDDTIRVVEAGETY